jgi:hypothetical protein
MKKNEKPSTSSASSAATEGVNKPASKKSAQGESPTANELGQGIDRPGFDLGGSTGKTHAGTGLGLGTDAFDTPGDRSLPGRKLDNPRTTLRWGGPEPRNTTAPDEKTSGAETLSTPETKKTR